MTLSGRLGQSSTFRSHINGGNRACCVTLLIRALRSAVPSLRIDCSALTRKFFVLTPSVFVWFMDFSSSVRLWVVSTLFQDHSLTPTPYIIPFPLTLIPLPFQSDPFLQNRAPHRSRQRAAHPENARRGNAQLLLPFWASPKPEVRELAALTLDP